MDQISTNPYFFTATILDWKPILKPNHRKDIILESLRFLVSEKRIIIYAFVIMDNHIHLIWQMRDPHIKSDVQRDFLKYTAQQIRFDILDLEPALLHEFQVNKKDRRYQFWQRNPLSVEIYSSWVMEQKLDYIHNNPVVKGIVDTAEEYPFSSASFYYNGQSTHDFLEHHEGF